MRNSIAYYWKKYLAGTLSLKENKYFLDCLKNDDKEIDVLLKEVWDRDVDDFVHVEHKKRIWNKIDKQINPSNRLSIYKYVAIAASFLLIIAFSSKLYSNHFNERKLVFLKVEAGLPTKQFILPDSSKVWLSSASSLTYSQKNFIKNRHLALEGEAYFEVEKNKKSPFTLTFNFATAPFTLHDQIVFLTAGGIIHFNRPAISK